MPNVRHSIVKNLHLSWILVKCLEYDDANVWPYIHTISAVTTQCLLHFLNCNGFRHTRYPPDSSNAVWHYLVCLYIRLRGRVIGNVHSNIVKASWLCASIIQLRDSRSKMKSMITSLQSCYKQQKSSLRVDTHNLLHCPCVFVTSCARKKSQPGRLTWNEDALKDTITSGQVR